MTRSAGMARYGAESLRVNLLARYGADPEFGDALEALHGEHYAMGPAWPYELRHVRRVARREAIAGHGTAARSLLDGLAEMSRSFGLDALGSDYAADRIHRWCILRRDAGHPIGADSIVSTTGEHYARPMVRSGRVEWRPNLEPKIDAERRAMEAGAPRSEARLGLAAIEEEWTDAGFTFHKSRTKATDHLEWLYRKLRHGETYGAIAERWSKDRPEMVDSETVAKSVARLMDLLLPGR